MARSAPARRRRLLRRWLPVAALALVGLLYYKPLRTYVEKRDVVATRAAEVGRLRAQQRALAARLERTAGDQELARQARRLGLVRPGERLFIVKGIGVWRQDRTAGRDR